MDLQLGCMAASGTQRPVASTWGARAPRGQGQGGRRGAGAAATPHAAAPAARSQCSLTAAAPASMSGEGRGSVPFHSACCCTRHVRGTEGTAAAQCCTGIGQQASYHTQLPGRVPPGPEPGVPPCLPPRCSLPNQAPATKLAHWLCEVCVTREHPQARLPSRRPPAGLVRSPPQHGCTKLIPALLLFWCLHAGWPHPSSREGPAVQGRIRWKASGLNGAAGAPGAARGLQLGEGRDGGMRSRNKRCIAEGCA